MKDNFGREIDYLRISVTARCNFRCPYCGEGKLSSPELTPENYAVLAKAFKNVGVRKLRLTGGEPLVRDDIVKVAEAVFSAGAPETLALTTNGSLLERFVRPLRDAGVSAVNISLDSLDPDEFARLTGSASLSAVLRGLDAALHAGFRRVRVNAVLLRGLNDGGAGALVDLARRYPLDVRFIELMPAGVKDSGLRVPTGELLARFPELAPTGETGDTAVYYAADGFLGRVGFISSVSHPFCGRCSRLRLLSDGRVKPCLGRPQLYDLRPYLNDPAALEAEIRRVILLKPAGHRFGEADGAISDMNTIGG